MYTTPPIYDAPPIYGWIDQYLSYPGAVDLVTSHLTRKHGKQFLNICFLTKNYSPKTTHHIQSFLMQSRTDMLPLTSRKKLSTQSLLTYFHAFEKSTNY